MRSQRLGCLLVLWALAACGGRLKHAMPHTVSQLDDLSVLMEAQAGVAEVDITPPPGLGLFGHGPEARIAEGTLLRLRCHAFVFVGARPDSRAAPEALAFVPCELAAPSLLLQREVAERVRARGLPLGADRIWISATHTHAAPGHYFASDSFSGPTSGRRIGFDRQVLAFLADRIAQAVYAAFEDLKPARWGWAARDELGLGRNRSHAAFARNRSLPRALASRLSGDAADVAQLAVDPQLSLLRIEQRCPGGYLPRAALVVYGLHPTVIDHHNTLYGGDAFGYAQRALANELTAQHGERVLVAVANGIEGDVTPIRNQATPREARRVGHELSARALRIWNEDFKNAEQALDAHAVVRSVYRDLDFSNALVGEHGRLCEVPELGTPGGGGADDHPTFLRSFEPYNPGVTARVSRPCEGPKYPIQNLGKAFAGKAFPRYAPVSAAIVGNGLMIALPAELTTVTGLRIRESAGALCAALPGSPDVIALLGLTNEYLEYVATYDEYALQHYEGAATLYGPHSAEFLREQSLCLVRSLQGDETSTCRGQTHAINRPAEVRYTPSFEIGWLDRVPAGNGDEKAALSQPRSTRTADDLCALQSSLRGIFPRDVTNPDHFGIQVLDGTRVLDDEQGENLRVRWNDQEESWSLTWTPELAPLAEPRALRVHFRVRTARGQVESAVGALDCRAARTRAQP
jgi:neutral ceramidase